jgi:ArsR family transcriptional regulator
MRTPSQTDSLREFSEILRAIAHPIRLAVIELLHQQGKLSVTEIYQDLNIEQAVASQHLRILKNKNVVDVERVGKTSLYYLSNPSYYDIVRVLNRVV